VSEGVNGTRAVTVAERVIRSMAQTAVEQEAHFCALDSVVGDGDFGFSLARGFEKVLEGLDQPGQLDRSQLGAFVKKVGAIITSRCGGTSGPIWGTAFLRAGAAFTGAEASGPVSEQVALQALRAAFEGIQQRGGAALGDKTLLDSLGPCITTLETGLASEGRISAKVLHAALDATERAAEATRDMVARRGRAAYTGERSRGSIDPGAAAVALMLRNVCTALEASGDVPT
jgi:phosphoenolpyruvate---glycerone phosphotransferase subunit DhaL